MKRSRWMRPAAALLASLLVVAVAPVLTIHADQGSTQAEETGELLGKHAVQMQGVLASAASVFGALPAVASTPFLGLTALTAAAMLSETEAVRESDNPWVIRLRDGAMVQQARRYANFELLLTLSALTVLSILANSGKIQGIAGKLLRAAEDSSVAIALLFLLLGAFARRPEEAAPQIGQMGVVSVTGGVLVALALTLAFAAMVVVRFALDVLVWLSPVPLIDLAFETLKVVLSVALLGLALLHPVLAAVVALGILLLSLLALGWALRLGGFAFRIVLNPWLCRLLQGLRPSLEDPKLISRLVENPDGLRLAVPACVLAARGLKRRRYGALVVDGDGRAWWKARWLWRPESRPLLQPGEKLQLGHALGWLELRVVDGDHKTLDRFALSRALADRYETLRERLGAEDLGTVGAVRLLLGTPEPPERTSPAA